jgi:plastocyanin
VQISALGIAFEQASVEVPADTAFTIHFDNKDAGQLHNVEIKDGGGATLFRGEIITGPAVIDYAVDPLPAGSYSFICSVHPNMTGTMTAS